MPNAQLAKTQLLSTNQFLVRDGTLGRVLTFEPPPSSQPQPLGNTPIWCASMPDGSNAQVFHQAPSGQAIYFPSFAIDMDDAGKPKVKFTQPNKSKVDTLLTMTLVSQSPTDAQLASAGGAPLVVAPPSVYADGSGRDSTVVQLVYSGGTKRLAFDSVTPDASGHLTCVATMTNYKTIGEVMGTLVNNDNDTSKHASIVVTRTIPALGVVAGTAPSTPPTHGQVTSVPPDWLAHRELLLQRAALTTRPDIMYFPPRPLPLPQPPAPTPGVTLYTLLTAQPVAATIPNVWFLDTISADIISGVTGITPTQAGYLQRTVPGYDGPLFRDVNDETAYYYLPNAFKIARRDTAPFLPLLNVTISGSTLEDAQATVFFTALPVVDAQKLQSAQELIQRDHPGETITMQPLPTPKGVSYGMFLPGATPFVTRQVPVALDQPLADSPQLALADFQTAFGSLTEKISQYLQGKITVPVGDAVVAVPLLAHADDFPGQYFQQTRSVDAGGQTITLALANAIESAVRVDALPIVATRGGSPVNCLTTYDPPLPTTLAAADDAHPSGASITVTVTPVSGPIDDTLQLACDTSQCHVVPDAAGLLRAVLNPNVPVKATKPVTVVVPAVLFGSDADTSKKIVVVGMTFQNGNTIQFRRPAGPPPDLVASDKPGEIDLTVYDYVLRRSAATDSIKYKLAITYASGHTVNDTDWRTAPNDNFVLDLP